MLSKSYFKLLRAHRKSLSSLSRKVLNGGWRDGSADRALAVIPEDLGSTSSTQNGSLQRSITRIPGDTMPALAYAGTRFAHGVQTD